MNHHTVLICVARTLEAAHKLSEMDDRLAQSDRDLMELLAGSRETIARSRRMLSDLKARATDK